MAAAGKFIGARTLQIYLLHPPLILLVLMLLKHTGTDWLGGERRNACVTALWPIGLTLVIILLTLLIHRMLERIRLGVLFDPPAAYTQAITRLHSWLSATPQSAVIGCDTKSPPVGGAPVGPQSPTDLRAWLQQNESSNDDQLYGGEICNGDAVGGSKSQQHWSFHRTVDEYPDHSGGNESNR